jgi:hypothetical protein
MTSNFLSFGYSPFNPAQFQFRPVSPTGNYNFSPSNPVGNLNLTIGGQVINTGLAADLGKELGVDLKAWFEKNPTITRLIDLGLSKINLNLDDKKQSQVTVDKSVATEAFLQLLSSNAVNMAGEIYTKGLTVRNNIITAFNRLGGSTNDFNQALVTGASYGEKNIGQNVYANALPVIATLEIQLRAAGVNVDELISRGVVSTYNNQVNRQNGFSQYLIPAAIVLAAFIFFRKK